MGKQKAKCDYCDQSKGPKDLYNDWHWSVEIDRDNELHIDVMIDYESAHVYIPINHCPMCGRKL